VAGKQPATYADIEAAPENLVAEIVDGEVRAAAPFDAISFPLADLWPLDAPLCMNEDPTPYCAGDR
jgi:hypothetical protein